jgi:hypothetical protein
MITISVRSIKKVSLCEKFLHYIRAQQPPFEHPNKKAQIKQTFSIVFSAVFAANFLPTSKVQYRNVSSGKLFTL